MKEATKKELANELIELSRLNDSLKNEVAALISTRTDLRKQLAEKSKLLDRALRVIECVNAGLQNLHNTTGLL